MGGRSEGWFVGGGTFMWVGEVRVDILSQTELLILIYIKLHRILNLVLAMGHHFLLQV